jgi:hypothetical protein
MAMSGKVTHPLIIVIALCFILSVVMMPLARSGATMPLNESRAQWHIQLNSTTNSTTNSTEEHIQLNLTNNSTTNSTENSTSNTPIAAPSQNATA